MSCEKAYTPNSFSEEVDDIEQMRKALVNVEQTFRMASTQSLLLGVDLVTLFDPTTSLQLKATEVKCKECATKIQDIQNKLPKTHFESNH